MFGQGASCIARFACMCAAVFGVCGGSHRLEKENAKKRAMNSYCFHCQEYGDSQESPRFVKSVLFWRTDDTGASTCDVFIDGKIKDGDGKPCKDYENNKACLELIKRSEENKLDAIVEAAVCAYAICLIGSDIEPSNLALEHRDGNMNSLGTACPLPEAEHEQEPEQEQ
eukprot:TRINITY_DN32690_c0_g1_i1.p1 TRINITY_DN32690_c0_g1~~TRINITY_DN32690_c0_g1_i1.p1  ORF type:complete len:184 (+),score=17.25 TRINITY_DN32690_c0_g1_i1:48-554(+)